MLVIALLAFFGWTVTYFVHLFLLQALPTPVRWVAGSVTAVLALIPAVPLSVVILRPIRRLLLRLRPVPQCVAAGPRRRDRLTAGHRHRGPCQRR
ncbi:hypothetical protein V8017_18735 [Stenotrophomonas rhizophila]